MNRFASTLKELGLSQNEINVYLALTVLGEAKGSLIAKKANLSRTTTLSILERLNAQGFLTSHKYHGTVYYWVESPTVIEEAFKNKAKLAKNLAASLGAFYRSGRSFPTGKILDTKDSIKNATENLILGTKSSEIYTFDSPGSGNYQKVFSDDYNKMLLSLKKQKNILTKTLVPFGSSQGIEPSKLTAQAIQIKEMPEGLDFEASIWLVDDNLILFSGNPPFMIFIKQNALANSFKQLFEYFWNK